jgi:hypothetical protein
MSLSMTDIPLAPLSNMSEEVSTVLLSKVN